MSNLVIPSHLIDVTFHDHTGYPPELAKYDTVAAMRDAAGEAGAVVTDFPDHLWIEPRDWAERARMNDELKLWPIHYRDRFTNQGAGNGGYSTHECTCHCLVACIESCRNRQRRIVVGPPEPRVRLPISAQSASVWLSALSAYAEANPSQWGGANVRQTLAIAARRGLLPDKIQPREYNFAHTLIGTCGAGGINQSRGAWVPLNRFPEGWQSTAKWFRALEYIFPDSWEQTVCLVLHGFAVGVGRAGHSVPYMRWVHDQQLMEYTDSYDILRYDSISRVRSTVGGSYAVVSVTTPDDWNQPAPLTTAL